jgi:hypothetical protein
MDARELCWRLRTGARTTWDRLRARVKPPHWNRRDLVSALAPLPELQRIRAALLAERWSDAHREIARVLSSAPQHFLIAPSQRDALAARIRDRFPESAANAAQAAAKILEGRYDLLGYDGLRFAPQGAVDWHFDPAHQRRAPRVFWSTVEFLDPRCGDHKIIWELNRHQHWLTLGRAFWLTGDQRYRSRMIVELQGWLEANPPLVGINWSSMLELALRSLSWIWALHFFSDSSRHEDESWSVDLLLALDRQLTHIEQNLSYYFSPNTHLLGEALALYVAGGALPIFKASRRREQLGRRILRAEINRQIAADGGHCERSTHYHRYALDFYLLALAVARIGNDEPAAGLFEGAVARMAAAAKLLADDRGRLPHFGDDDGGMATPIVRGGLDDVGNTLATASVLLRSPEVRTGPIGEETQWLLAHPQFTERLEAAERSGPAAAPVSSAALEQTGYYVSRSADGHHLVIDGGPHGHGNCGHAHADALSLTLSLDGAPFLIDPGTGCYTIDPAVRDRLRSSMFHNTLTLDERSQSTADGPFHWARTANARVRTWVTASEFDYFEGFHDGYGPMEHRRHLMMRAADLLVVADLVSGDGTHRADVHWHIDPHWRARTRGPITRFTRISGPAALVDLVVPDGTVEAFCSDETTGFGRYSPVYGRIAPTTTLRISRTARCPFWVVSVFGLDRSNPLEQVELTEHQQDVGSLSLRIERLASIDRLTLGGDPPGSALFTREMKAARRKVAG